MNAHEFVLVAFLHKQNANLPFKEKLLIFAVLSVMMTLRSTATLLSGVRQSD